MADHQGLTQALRNLAADAATRLTTLVASGDQIPFDVAEGAGEHTQFYSYAPRTIEYVRERTDELLGLQTWRPARNAVVAAEVAAPYLEARGDDVPSDPGERARAMLVRFLCGLWDGCAEFALDPKRLDRALREVEAELIDPERSELLVAPLAGFTMPLAAIELPSGVRIVRADTIEVPGEATASEGMHRAPWDPQFLAMAEQDTDSETAPAALRQLRDLITVLRLFKDGGVGLGPYIFAPTGEGGWRRIATGAPATRPGGYRLSEPEAARLRLLASQLEERPDPSGPLAWAIHRFELGCERRSALGGLSDHLLAIRALLEADGPVGATLPVRAAALVPNEPDATAQIERALELERILMTGRSLREFDENTESALGLAAWLEKGVRTIVRDAALGDHGADLGAAADQKLIIAGLEGGDASFGIASVADWDVDSEFDEPYAPEIQVHEGSEADAVEEADPEPAVEFDEPEPDRSIEPKETFIMSASAKRSDWLAEVSRKERTTLEWSAADMPHEHTEDREPVDVPSARHLFPVPDDADWSVRELEYDRKQRAWVP